MRFNTLGDAATACMSINGSIPAALSTYQGGNVSGCSWLTPTKMLFNSGGVAGGGPWILQTYDTGTTAIANVDTAGANYVVGGNSIWAGFLAGSGLRTNIGGLGPFPSSVLGDVSPTGQVVRINSGATGTGLTVYSSAGVQTLSLPTTTAWTVPGPGNVSCRQNVVTWRTVDGNWQCSGTSGESIVYQVRVDAVSWTVPIVVASGDLLFLEFDATNNQLCLRYARSGQGWVIATGETWFPDSVEVTAGTVRLGYCTNAGETADSLVVIDLVISTNVMTTSTVSGGVLVPGTPTLNPRVTFAVTDPAGLAGTLDHPKFTEPFVDLKTGHVKARAWTEWIDSVTRAGNSAADAINTIPTASAPPGFSTIASSGEPPINANTAILTLEAGPGIDIQLIPPSQTVKISAVPGTLPTLAAHVWMAEPNAEPVMIPGPVGATGPQGLMGPPGVDAETPEPQIIVLNQGSTAVDYVVMSDGANPPSPVDDGAGNFIYVGYTP